MSRLIKAAKSEQEARVKVEEKLEEAEQALTNLTQENSILQSRVDEVEKVWGAKLEETHTKLKVVESELASLKQMILQMLTAIMGKTRTFVFLL